MNTIPKPTCDARAGYRFEEGREVPLWCRTTVGLTKFVDAHDQFRFFCVHHRDAVVQRYGLTPRYASTYGVREGDDPITAAKAREFVEWRGTRVEVT